MLGPANTIYGKGPARPKVGGVVATIRKGGKSKKSSNIKPSKSSNQSTSNYCQIKVSPATFQRNFEMKGFPDFKFPYKPTNQRNSPRYYFDILQMISKLGMA